MLRNKINKMNGVLRAPKCPPVRCAGGKMGETQGACGACQEEAGYLKRGY
ncbi:MAG: hypothetical protein PHI30_03280 [Oscillibacter sp.]|nr:hypothetical protein [Oscillibacter sp.]